MKSEQEQLLTKISSRRLPAWVVWGESYNERLKESSSGKNTAA